MPLRRQNQIDGRRYLHRTTFGSGLDNLGVRGPGPGNLGVRGLFDIRCGFGCGTCRIGLVASRGDDSHRAGLFRFGNVEGDLVGRRLSGGGVVSGDLDRQLRTSAGRNVEHEGIDAPFIDHIHTCRVFSGELGDLARRDRPRESLQPKEVRLQLRSRTRQSHGRGAVRIGRDVDTPALRRFLEPVLNGLKRGDLRVHRLAERLDRDIGAALGQVGIEERKVLEFEIPGGPRNSVEVFDGELARKDPGRKPGQAVVEHHGRGDSAVGVIDRRAEHSGEFGDVISLRQTSHPSGECLVETEPGEDRQYTNRLERSAGFGLSGSLDFSVELLRLRVSFDFLHLRRGFPVGLDILLCLHISDDFEFRLGDDLGSGSRTVCGQECAETIELASIRFPRRRCIGIRDIFLGCLDDEEPFDGVGERSVVIEAVDPVGGEVELLDRLGHEHVADGLVLNHLRHRRGLHHMCQDGQQRVRSNIEAAR